MKIIDKMNASIKEGKPFFSFEFFPPRTEEVRCYRLTLQESFPKLLVNGILMVLRNLWMVMHVQSMHVQKGEWYMQSSSCILR